MPPLIRRIWSSPVLRVLAYFAVVLAAARLVVWLVPSAGDLLFSSAPWTGTADPRELLPASGSTEAPDGRALAAAIALAATLVCSAPVVWLYMVTKRQEGYERTFVQVLILLPLVVAAVVRVVRGDLALAFALAGIVAAVRFRTTLRDLKNAVYAFAVIGIGLAAGTGAWMLAALLALVFGMVAYALWRWDIGGWQPSVDVAAGPMRLSEALVPGEGQQSVAVGRESLTAPVGRETLVGVSDRAAQLARYVRADALRSKRKYDTLLLVYAANAPAAESAVAELLDDVAVRWHLVETFPGPENTTVLEYLLRMQKRADVAGFLDALGCAEGCPMVAAEVKPVRGMRQLLT